MPDAGTTGRPGGRVARRPASAAGEAYPTRVAQASALAAGEAIRVLAAALPALSEEAADVGARGDLLYGAYLAGTAFAVTGSGLHHKICHVLGGRYGLPHAQTHAIMLPYVLAFNAPGAPDAARRIGEALGSEDPAAALQALAARLGLPRRLRDIGLREEQLAEAAQLIEPVVPADNPVPAGAAALQALLRHAWAGDPAGLRPAGSLPAGSGPGTAQAGREDAVTAEVLASFGGADAPRFRDVMQSLVRHLHAFAREVRLTEAEWQQGIDFLTRAGAVDQRHIRHRARTPGSRAASSGRLVRICRETGGLSPRLRVRKASGWRWGAVGPGAAHRG